MKSLIEKNDIKMYSTHNEGKFVVAADLNFAAEIFRRNSES